MSIFFRYIFRQAAGSLLLILTSLGGVVWIALALKQLNVVTSQGQDAVTLLKMTTLALPNLLAIIAPFALLIAAIHTLNRLNSDSELIVMTASGATVWTPAKPLLILALLVTIAVAFVNHVGMPWSLQQLRGYIIQVRTDLLSQVIQPGRFSQAEAGLTFHIRERTSNGELLGLVVDDRRSAKEHQAYLAEVAQIVKQDGTAYIIMTNGHIHRRELGDDSAQIIAFQKYIVDLDRFDKKEAGKFYLKPRERYFHQLVNVDESDRLYQVQKGQFRAELHERFANPLYPLAFVLIALATVGQAQSTRQNRNENMIMGFVAAVGCRLAGLAVNNLVALNAAYVPLLYAIPLAAIVLSLLAIVRNASPRAGPTQFERVGDLVQLLFSRLPALPAFRRGGAAAATATAPRSQRRGGTSS